MGYPYTPVPVYNPSYTTVVFTRIFYDATGTLVQDDTNNRKVVDDKYPEPEV
jgi:hypothetical protein